MSEKQFFKISGTPAPRVAFGDRSTSSDDLDRCPSCGTGVGHLHFLGCNLEPCPSCTGLAQTCECNNEDRRDFDFEGHARTAVSSYLELRPFYQNLAEAVRKIVNESLQIREIKVHSVQARDKDPASLRNKASRPSDTDPDKPKYIDPLNEITDLAAVRIITFFPNTLKIVDQMLVDEFEILERSDKADLLMAEEKFGYRSVHYLVKISSKRSHLPEYVRFSRAVIEIQVRTVLQHAWAEIEHDIQYKSSSVIPTEIRRRFIALAGMLEIADREFQAVQDDDRRLREQARSQIAQGRLDQVEITPDAIKAFLDKKIGSDARMSTFSYEFLTRVLLRLGFRTLRQIEACIAPFDDTQLSKIAYGARQGQITRFELMLLAGMGQNYAKRHPWRNLAWFTERQDIYLLVFGEQGIDIGNFDPANDEPARQSKAP